jgi:hypothetical protein
MNPLSFHPFRHIAGALVVTALLGATGCVASGPPAALRHIGPPSIERSATRTDALIAERRSPALDGRGYTPAEQIAVYAGHELEDGNELDAAVLLSLASYRYHQQAYLALQIGKSQACMINPATLDRFSEWVGHEIDTFNDQHFDHEIALLRQHRFGFAAPGARAREALKATVAGLEAQDLVDHAARRYRPENGTLIVAGAGAPQRMMATIEELFAGWKPQAAGAQAAGAAAAQQGAGGGGGQHVLLDDASRKQARVIAAYPGVLGEGDRAAALVLRAILETRLARELREAMAATYHVSVSFQGARS